MDAVQETKKRIEIATIEAEKLKEHSLGIILTGSVAYSQNLHVSNKSDIDLVVIVKNLKKSIPLITESEEEQIRLQKRFFEGYCIKKDINGIPVSMHVLSEDAYNIISRCFVADIRVYRIKPKEDIYRLYNFERGIYNYEIKNIGLPDLENGVRTIVPVAFINSDRYYIGTHRDKLLSEPKILYENNNFVSTNIDKLWKIVVENLHDEARRIHGNLDLKQMNILNALSKKDRMRKDVKECIEDKTKFYLRQITG